MQDEEKSIQFDKKSTRSLQSADSTTPTFSKVQKVLYSTILLVGALTAALIMGLFLPSIQEVKTSLLLTNSQIDIILAMYQVLSGIMPLYWGPLADQIGTKLVLIISFLIFLLANVGCYVSNSFGSLVFMVSLIGVGFAGPIVIGSNLINFIHDDEGMRGLVMKSYFIMPLMGSAFGPVLGGYFTNWQGWRFNFLLVALITLGLSCFIVFCLPETKKNKEQGKGFIQFITMPLKSLNLLFDSWIICACVLIVSLQFGSNYIILSTQTIKMELEYHLTASEIGLTYLPTGLGCVLASLVGNPLINKLTNYFERIKNKLLFSILLGMQLLLIATMLLNGYFLHQDYTIWHSMAYQLMIAFCSVLTLSCMCSFLVEFRPNQTGAIAALPTFFRSLTAALYSFVNTPITDAWGYFTLLCIMGLANVLCVGLFILLILKH